MKRLVLAAAAALIAATALPALADRDDHPAGHHHAKHRAHVDRDWRADRANGYWSNGVWYAANTSARRHNGYTRGRFNPHGTNVFDPDRDGDRDRRHPHR